MRRTMRSLIIFLTLAKGSSAARAATAANTRLLSCWALFCKNWATNFWPSGCPSARNCTRAEDFFCARDDGKYLVAAPETAALERISIAFSMATISSARSVCLDSKSAALLLQRAVVSAKYALSAFMVFVVSLFSPSSLAFASNLAALSSAFAVRSADASLDWAVRSLMSISNACLAFISVFRRSVRLSVNLSNSFSSISIMPVDWKS
mmetsp:Transcript_112517/g.206496  ORF Transcript_112517/g.206496 Transcript_112517/m.206496 type:complete len:208 (-) Transcript_112517:658-1281(-)